jgi:hypothetical protein
VSYINIQSGAFVVAKADVNGDKDPTLWRIDGKALLQKYLPFIENGKTLYKSTSTVSLAFFILRYNLRLRFKPL